MNMEDRLREAFEQEAEQLHAPHGSPETAVRRGRRRRASNLIGGAALVLTLVGGTAAGVQLLGNTDEPEEGNLASAIETDQTVDETISTERAPTAGVVDFGWERVALPQPSMPADVWNIQVVATNDEFVAFADRVVVCDDESVPFHLGSQTAVGTSVMDADGNLLTTAGYLHTVDPDGDVMYIYWRGTGDGSEWSFVSGTGKYEGIQGGGTSEVLVALEDGSQMIRWHGKWTQKGS